jgi:arylformamidase
MTTTLEAEYDNRARVPEHPEIFARWKRDAVAYRDEATGAGRADLGLSYGPTARQTIDLFYPPERDGAPLAMFIHGGYWRSLEPALFSHIARGLNAHGVLVAVVGYDLCPQVRITDIIAQVQAATRFLWARFRQRMLVYGHSAGGHLAACLVATDWSAHDESLPADLTAVGMAISGVFDLTPLLQVSMNADLRMDADEAARISPLTWPVGADRVLDVIVGADESSAFREQSQRIAATWDKAGASTRYEERSGADHFTILDPFGEPDSAEVRRLVALASRTMDRK